MTIRCPIVLGGILAVVVASECSISSQDPVTSSAQKTATATQVPISTADAPPELLRLIEDGKVQVVYDSEPEFVRADRGWADFHIQLKYSFNYDLTKTRKNGRWQVKLTVTELVPQIELTHLIRLPSSYKSPDVWKLRTLRHEFDHVAVSLDPRAMLLLKHLVEHLPVIERTLEPKETPSQAVLNRLLDEEVVKRREAVVELLQQSNRLLDKVGAHGAQAVPDRAAFFAKLYTKEHLAEQKFRYVEQVLKLLDSEEYHQAESRLPFLPRDPAER
ncbi:MAG: hypothetical protein ACKV2Q_10650 [Planctomycetaceae bacterium]